jgi:hypothetical protein
MIKSWISIGLRWLAGAGAGALSVALVYLLDSLQAIPIDMGTTEGTVLFVVVMLASKLLSFLVGKIPVGANARKNLLVP